MSCYQGVQDKLQAVARDWFLSDFVRLSQVQYSTVHSTQYNKQCHYKTIPRWRVCTELAMTTLLGTSGPPSPTARLSGEETTI